MQNEKSSPIFCDVRMIELKMRQGEITKKQWQAYLDKLPDVSNKGTFSSLFRSQQVVDSDEELSEMQADDDGMDESALT